MCVVIIPYAPNMEVVYFHVFDLNNACDRCPLLPPDAQQQQKQRDPWFTDALHSLPNSSELEYSMPQKNQTCVCDNISSDGRITSLNLFICNWHSSSALPRFSHDSRHPCTHFFVQNCKRAYNLSSIVLMPLTNSYRTMIGRAVHPRYSPYWIGCSQSYIAVVCYLSMSCRLLLLLLWLSLLFPVPVLSFSSHLFAAVSLLLLLSFPFRLL